MKVYTIHQPPPRKNADSSDPARFVFVRDGFHFWAFVLAPLWMLRHQLWLVLLLYVVATIAVHAALWALGITGAVTVAVGFLIALLVGFEAGSMRRWSFARQGWTDLGPVVAPDRPSAERRFFDAWASNSWVSGSAANAWNVKSSVAEKPLEPPASMPGQPPAPAIIGLFPEPQSRR
jgi:hypothetical protein